MQYAIINPTLQTVEFYASFDEAEAACIAYNVKPGTRAYVIEFEDCKIEQL